MAWRPSSSLCQNLHFRRGERLNELDRDLTRCGAGEGDLASGCPPGASRTARAARTRDKASRIFPPRSARPLGVLACIRERIISARLQADHISYTRLYTFM